MPCYEVNTVSVEFSPRNYGTLSQAVQALGGQMCRNGELATVVLPSGRTVTLDNGQAIGRAEDINALRVAYSQAIVTQAQQWAKAKGWQASVSTGGTKTTFTAKGAR